VPRAAGADTHAAALTVSVAAIECSRHANDSDAQARRLPRATGWTATSHVQRSCTANCLRDYPRDRLALLIAHGLDYRLGQREMLRDRVARVLPHWDERDAHYGYLLGMHAFGLEENGDYDRCAGRSAALARAFSRHASAIHVISHVLGWKGSPDKESRGSRRQRRSGAAMPAFASIRPGISRCFSSMPMKRTMHSRPTTR
jgi:hypothetical protein